MMAGYFNKGEPTAHPCEKIGCTFLALYDDEPYCILHSKDSMNRTVKGYSYLAKQ